jgi:hypothetical protein
VRRLGRSKDSESYYSHSSARIVIQGDSVVVDVDRSASRAVYTTPHPVSDEALVHPYLAPVAAVAAVWLDRQSFHGGAFVVDGGVWGVLGSRGSGKSSTLALLARDGYQIFCDDLIVTDMTTAMAGPRSIDLRTEAANELGVGEDIGVAGTRARWRLRLGAVAPELKIRGWIHLDWSDTIELVPMRPIERVAALARHGAVNVVGAGQSTALLELSALPTWTLRRPHGWGSAREAMQRLLDLAHSGR